MSTPLKCCLYPNQRLWCALFTKQTSHRSRYIFIFLLFSTLRRDQGVSGQPVSIMVEGVQVTLPSYEEAVSGSGASASASAESRVQIVLSEGQHTTMPEAAPSRPSSLKQQQQSEMAVVHPVPPSSSSSSHSPSPSSSTWVLEHAGAAAPSSSQRRPSAGSDQHSLSLDSEMDYSDGEALFRHTFFLNLFKILTLY